MASLLRLFEQAEAKTGSKTALAKALGVSATSVTRYFQNKPASVENLLILARILGKSPRMVLLAGGKEEALALIEASFGSGAKALPPVLPDDALSLAQRWLALNEHDRITVARMIDVLHGIPKDVTPAVVRTGTIP